MQVTVKYDEVYEALEPLRGLKLRGSINGPPTQPIPLRRIVEKGLEKKIIAVEEYRGSRIVAAGIDEELVLICHFGVDEPDDFCIAIEGKDAWKRVTSAANKLAKLTRESYTPILSAIIHALQGIIAAEEGNVEEISDPDQVIEELLTWLPEYIALTD